MHGQIAGLDLQIEAWVGHFMCGETLLHGIGQIRKLCLAQLSERACYL